MKSVVIVFITVSMLTLCDGRRIVDLTHTFDGNATKYPLSTFGVGKDFKYYNHWKISEKYHGDMW